MRRIVVTADSRSPYSGPVGYWTYCVKTMEAYCADHGFEFKFIQLPSHTALVQGRHVAWQRIQLLQGMVDDYDEIVWVDSDVTAVRMDFDIFALLKTSNNHPDWVRDPAVRPVAYMTTDKPFHTDSVCSGIFLLDCSDKAAARAFLQDWWTDLPDPKYATERPWDQAVLTYGWSQNLRTRSRIHAADLWTLTLKEPETQALYHIMHGTRACREFHARKYYYRHVLKAAGGGCCPQPFGSRAPPPPPAVAFLLRKGDAGVSEAVLFLRHALERGGHEVVFYTDQVLAETDPALQDIVSYDLRYIIYPIDVCETDFSKYCTVFVDGFALPAKALEHLRSFPALQRIYLHTAATMTPVTAPAHMHALHNDYSACWVPEVDFVRAEWLEVLNKGKLRMQSMPLMWDDIGLRTAANGFAAPLYLQRQRTDDAHIVLLDTDIESTVLALDALFRRHPLSIRIVHCIRHRAVYGVLAETDLYKRGKLIFYAPMSMSSVLQSLHGPAVDAATPPVVYVGLSADPYTVCSVLSTGAPLVHALHPLAATGAGYFVDHRDISEIANAVHAAITGHTVEAAHAAASDYLNSVDPYSATNAARIQDMMQCKARTESLERAGLSQPLVVTYENTDHPDSAQFLSHTTACEWEVKRLGQGDTWHGFRTRMLAYHAFLSTLHPKRVVVLSDARDVVCARHPAAFMEAFASYGAPIVTSMEIFCNGSCNDDRIISNPVKNGVLLHAYWAHHGVAKPPVRAYANAGLLAGYAGDLCALYAWGLAQGYADDQLALGNYMNTFPNRVAADTKAELLHTTGFALSGGLANMEKQAQDAPTFAEVFGRGAFFVHFPNNETAGQGCMYRLFRKLVTQDGMHGKHMNALYDVKKDPGWKTHY